MIWNKLYGALTILCTLLIFSCSDDNGVVITDPIDSIQDAKDMLADYNDQNILLTSVDEILPDFNLIFEDLSEFNLDDIVDSVLVDSTNWSATIYYNDGTSQTIDFLGNENGLQIDTIILNPYGFSPLGALAEINTLVNGKIKIKVTGQNGVSTDVEKLMENFGDSFSIPILGLYPEFSNQVEITFTNTDGEPRVSKQAMIQTSLIPELGASINVTINDIEEMAEGFTMINYLGSTPRLPFIIDAFGDVRWILDYEAHPDLFDLDYANGPFRLQNGNLCFGNKRNNRVYEVDMLGKILNTWDMPGHYFHHAIEEKPDGNFLVLTSKDGVSHLGGSGSIEDYIIEIDRNSGQIMNEWDLKESLDENRIALGLFDNGTFNDWFHGNGLAYDASDNTIVISGRTQGVVKITEDNEVVWILANHNDWDTSRNGIDMNQYLLDPLDGSNSAITDTGVINGTVNHPDFEWNWYQHAPLVKPDGNIMLFDNGDNRNYTGAEEYSRAVEFQIDEQNMTIKQIWDYGKERGLETYARVVSDVDYLEEYDHVLFCPGFRTENSNGVGGKVVEIDYATKIVVFEVEISNSGVALHQAERLTLYP